jgi:peptidoglycan hydrolase-like protein with peptidoglycan-binding domain
MRKIKNVIAGLVASLVFASVAVVGASAATPSSTSTTVSTASTSTSSISSLLAINNATTLNLGKITPAFNYGPNGGPSIDTIVFTNGGLVQEGDVGYAVKEFQEDINLIRAPNITADGYFGSQTYAAVLEFQQDWDNPIAGNSPYLSQDGIVGKNTLNVMESFLRSVGLTPY